MGFDDRYQDAKDGPLSKVIRQRISAFHVPGVTLADIGEVLGFSGSFVSQLLNEKRPGRVRTIHVPGIIQALERAERDRDQSAAKRPQTTHERRHSSSKENLVKPQIFIASSTEKLPIAYDLHEALGDDFDVTVWKQGAFRLSKSAMESLIELLPNCDFGVFVLAPDDFVETRNTRREAVRDNVIFELGLFIGHLGRERCYFVQSNDANELHLPSDLVGLMAATYDPRRPDNNMVAALGPAANRIRKEVMRLGRRDRI
jgi:predicted nucleotide-binding protein